MGKDAQILGMNLRVPTDVSFASESPQVLSLSRSDLQERNWDDMGAAITAGLENGTLTPIVDKEYPMEKAAQAHKDIIESSGAKGNLILTPN